mmetsp:Transcript_24996/g.71974  ORF Transcript_24996/g.71974 Transcript_24996/m.71974 type:complete len:346 (-) Transcript_24996:98-1135(-)
MSWPDTHWQLQPVWPSVHTDNTPGYMSGPWPCPARSSRGLARSPPPRSPVGTHCAPACSGQPGSSPACPRLKPPHLPAGKLPRGSHPQTRIASSGAPQPRPCCQTFSEGTLWALSGSLAPVPAAALCGTLVGSESGHGVCHRCRKQQSIQEGAYTSPCAGTRTIRQRGCRCSFPGPRKVCCCSPRATARDLKTAGLSSSSPSLSAPASAVDNCCPGRCPDLLRLSFLQQIPGGFHHRKAAAAVCRTPCHRGWRLPGSSSGRYLETSAWMTSCETCPRRPDLPIQKPGLRSPGRAAPGCRVSPGTSALLLAPSPPERPALGCPGPASGALRAAGAPGMRPGASSAP